MNFKLNCKHIHVSTFAGFIHGLIVQSVESTDVCVYGGMELCCLLLYAVREFFLWRHKSWSGLI